MPMSVSLSRCAIFSCQFSHSVDVYVIVVDMVTSVADTGTSAEYIDTAVKPEHIVVTIDKKALEMPTGMLAFLNYYSLEIGMSCFLQHWYIFLTSTLVFTNCLFL